MKSKLKELLDIGKITLEEYIDIGKEKIDFEKKIELANLKRPPSESETVGTWKGKKHSHILLDGSNCEILSSDQFGIIQDKMRELQDLIKVNILISFFYTDGKLNKDNGE